VLGTFSRGSSKRFYRFTPRPSTACLFRRRPANVDRATSARTRSAIDHYEDDQPAMLEMTSGEILFGGVSDQQDLLAWKQRMGYVPEEPHLYGISVVWNIS